MTATETHHFQAEVQQVLQLVIHSLYSNKDIFLRELVSNASDACDKLRFEALQDPELYGDEPGLKIEIHADKAARTLSVRDTGIGMSKQELIENLGTVARSGTRRFLEAIAEGRKADLSLIGQFGVGFYSAFIVADRVTVTSRKAGASGSFVWESTGDGQFTLSEGPEDAPRGTTVTLHLREGEDDYLEDWKLRALIRTYSDHIGFPIRMRKPGDGAEYETVNQASALWMRPKNELTDEDYQGFYRHVAHDFGEALAWTHNRVEGNQNFTSLLYVPARAPFDFQFSRDDRKGLKLYIKRVFIMDASAQMLPAYLRFVRGVVDSDDLPLNVSREILQESRQVERIKGALTKRVLDLLDRLAKDEPEKYAGFWREFGTTLKEGVAEDAGNRERVLKLLRFPSTRSENAEQLVSLDEYIGRMVAGQEDIYYLTADGWNAARNSPQLEALKARGVEVLLMHERIDEWMSGYLHEYAGKRLRNVAKGELDLDKLGGQVDKAAREQAAKDAEGVVARLKGILGDAVKDVRVSARLTTSPSCIVLDEHDMALHMQRLLKAAGHDAPAGKPILEINPEHALVKRLAGEADDARAADLGWLLLEQAQLAEGGVLDDPAAFIARTTRLIASGA